MQARSSAPSAFPIHKVRQGVSSSYAFRTTVAPRAPPSPEAGEWHMRPPEDNGLPAPRRSAAGLDLSARRRVTGTPMPKARAE
jgi:hypothetical protein